MNNCKLNDENWNELLYAIRHQKCILMAGPDLAIEQRNGHTELLMKILAKRFSEKLSDKIRDRINASNLAEAAQSYWLEKNRSNNAVKIFAEQFYSERRNLTSELHRHLAELPFYFMITSTPDKMLENALREKGKIPKTEIYDYYNGKGKKCDISDMGTLENPLIYYLCGTTDKPDSLVITEDDLLNFIVAVISENPPLPVNIKSEISSKDKSFLFLGFGFNHWYLRILLHVLGCDKDNCSFALEQSSPDKSTILFYEKKHKIMVFDQELDKFVQELKARYESSACISHTPIEDSPSVFICHAKADESHANWLFDEFTKAGFRPFMDNKNIEPGVDWNRLIEKTIKETDFFIVLKSKALEKRPEGYVNKEIILALDRQKYFNPGSPFIIPVRVEDCELEWEEELGVWQDADLTDKANIGSLITAIRRHYARRKKARS